MDTAMVEFGLWKSPRVPRAHDAGVVSMARLTYWEARALASSFGFDPREDFHANGSRGRYFAAYVRRVIERGDSD
mgnify:CR=1 FL=1